MTLLIRLLQTPIHLYRLAIAPVLAPACRYHPSCSAYALEALEQHGPIRGLLMAIGRLLRCHPVRFLGGGEGFDPVPPRRPALHPGAPPQP
jgi:uncharacterized protein